MTMQNLTKTSKEYEQSEASRIAFHEAGKRSFEHYQKTGLHVTHTEIKTWIDSMNTEKELPPPTPHI